MSNELHTAKKYEGILLYEQSSWVEPRVEQNDWTLRLADILLSENLVVIAGLGTSLCLNQDGEILAPTMSKLWTEVTNLPSYDDIPKHVSFDPESKDVEALLSHCQLFCALNKSDTKVANFVEAAEQKILELCNFPKSGTSLPIHESFLRKVARRSIRQPRMKLFTTNYDLCFETAASAAEFITIDGFGHTPPHTFNGVYFAYDLVRRELEGDTPNYIPNVFQFYKLHGSVDWVFSNENEIERGLKGPRAMIFPRYGKFEASYQQPYFEIMARLQSCLRQPNTGLLIIGYGCNDKHINEPLMSALRGNVGLKCAVVDPVLSQSEKNDVHIQLKKLIDGGDTRIMLVAAKFENFVTHIPDLVATTEQEAHMKRTRRGP